MAQLYVGKRPISKGIGRAIRRFVVLSFASAVPMDRVAGEYGVQIAGTLLECCKEAFANTGGRLSASSNLSPGNRVP